MIRDTVVCDDRPETRTHKVFDALDAVCYQFDLGKPIWLDSNIADFKRHDKTRFLSDNFIEAVDRRHKGLIFSINPIDIAHNK